MLKLHWGDFILIWGQEYWNFSKQYYKCEWKHESCV